MNHWRWCSHSSNDPRSIRTTILRPNILWFVGSREFNYFYDLNLILAELADVGWIKWILDDVPHDGKMQIKAQKASSFMTRQTVL